MSIDELEKTTIVTTIEAKTTPKKSSDLSDQFGNNEIILNNLLNLKELFKNQFTTTTTTSTIDDYDDVETAINGTEPSADNIETTIDDAESSTNAETLISKVETTTNETKTTTKNAPNLRNPFGNNNLVLNDLLNLKELFKDRFSSPKSTSQTTKVAQTTTKKLSNLRGQLDKPIFNGFLNLNQRFKNGLKPSEVETFAIEPKSIFKNQQILDIQNEYEDELTSMT
jgi:hypothetical protein